MIDLEVKNTTYQGTDQLLDLIKSESGKKQTRGIDMIITTHTAINIQTDALVNQHFVDLEIENFRNFFDEFCTS